MQLEPRMHTDEHELVFLLGSCEANPQASFFYKLCYFCGAEDSCKFVSIGGF